MNMAASSKPHNLTYLHRDRGYRFEERDPQMVELCDIIHKSEMDIMGICRAVYSLLMVPIPLVTAPSTTG